MRIAIFTDTFLPQVNGVTNTLARLGDYFEQNKIEYLFITPNHPKRNSNPYNIEEFFSTRFIFYPECRFAFPSQFRVHQILKEFKPDLIQLMTEFNVGLSGLQYAKKYNIPYVTNFSTNYEDMLTSYNMGFLLKPMWQFMKKFHSRAALTLTPSKATENLLHSKEITNTKIFSRGIDFHRFNPEHRNESLRKALNIHDKIVLLFVGRLSPEKGLSLLRESMMKLNEKYPDRLALILTGEGPMFQELKDTMPHNVIFTGYKQGQGLSEIYASSDIFAFPSGFETFGNVVLEAMASGIPAVGVAKGGVTESILPGKTGLLALPDDVDSFTSELSILIENDSLRRQLGSGARAFAKTRSWETIISDLVTTYEAIIDSPAVFEYIQVS